MWPGALLYIGSTLLVYTPEQICLPHCTSMSQCIRLHYSLHIDPTLLHTVTKLSKLQHLFTILLQYMCEQQMYPSNATNTPHAQITQLAFMGEVCQYVCHIWSCSYQWCSQNCCTQTTTTPKPDYIYWIGHFAKSVNKICITNLYLASTHLEVNKLYSDLSL